MLEWWNNKEENSKDDKPEIYGTAEGTGDSSETVSQEFSIPQSRTSGGNRRTLSHLWLVSYSDFMTILMIFFLIMYGYTYLTKMHLLKIKGYQLDYSDFSKVMNELNAEMPTPMEIREDIQKVVVQLPEKIFFDTGKAIFHAQAKGVIDRIAQVLQQTPGDIIVEGHTDNVPILKGAYPSNWELSAARAFEVINELTKSGVSPTRLSAWGFGENRPSVPNDTKENRRRNRRIEIILLKKSEEPH